MEFWKAIRCHIDLRMSLAQFQELLERQPQTHRFSQVSPAFLFSTGHSLTSLQSKAYEEIHIENSAVAFVQGFHETFLNQTFKYFSFTFCI